MTEARYYAPHYIVRRSTDEETLAGITLDPGTRCGALTEQGLVTALPAENRRRADRLTTTEPRPPRLADR